MSARARTRDLVGIAVLLLMGAGSLACVEVTAEPLGQVVLHVTTDAPLPPPPTVPLRPDEAPPLFDFLSFELVPPDAADPCEGCAREFAIDRDAVMSGRASVGFVYPPGMTGHRARVRLYRGTPRDRGRARAASTLEAVVALPPLTPDGIQDLSVTLLVDDLASPRGTLDEPIAPQTGPADTSLVGTWPGARRVPCPSDPGPDEACVPGGAYWMGDPTLASLDDFELEGNAERLVVLSPFFVDVHEVTVAEMRASGMRVMKREGGRLIDPSPRDTSKNAECAYTEAPGELEQHPINCITWATAREYCRARGGDLPTEAQLEYLAGGLRSQPFVWGVDPPSCTDAVAERDPEARDDQVSCTAQGIGHDEIGKGQRDRLVLSGATVVDLAGNVSELARDVFSRTGEGFWKSGVFVDPVADVHGLKPTFSHALRGGNFWAQRGLMYSAIRQYNLDEDQDSTIGFRCARDTR